jgi:Subtilase family
MDRIRMVLLVGLVLVFGASKGYPQPGSGRIDTFPKSASRGEPVMLDAKAARRILFGPQDKDRQKKQVPLTPMKGCPKHLLEANPFKSGNSGLCIQIPDKAWGGMQDLEVDGAKGSIEVYGESIVGPGVFGKGKNDGGVFEGKDGTGFDRDMRRVFLLWVPNSVVTLEKETKVDLMDLFQQGPTKGAVQFNPRQYEFRALTSYIPLASFDAPAIHKNFCGGAIRLIEFSPPSGSPQSLGFMIEQVNNFLRDLGAPGTILEPYADAKADPMPMFGTPAAISPDTKDADSNPTWQTDITPSTLSSTGRDTTVAILDTGVRVAAGISQLDASHSKNYSTWRFNPIKAPTGSDPADMDDLVLDTKGKHGSPSKIYTAHGTAAAMLVTKLAPNTKVLSVKVCTGAGLCPSPAVIQGACYALNQGTQNRPELAKKLVLNLSLGGDTPSGILNGILQNAIDAGVPVVASVGNQWRRANKENTTGGPLGVLNHFPAAALDNTNNLMPGIIGVGAFGKYKRSAKPGDFSNQGTYLDVFAPGVKLKVEIPGNTGTDEYDGTSFAAPIVAGTLARARETDTNSSPAEFEAKIKNLTCSVPPVPVPVLDTDFGPVHVLNTACFP